MRFYTYAPIPYPYILRNIKQKSLPSQHEIVDCGIMDLLKYPRYSEKILKKWQELKPKGWKVVPDCPDLNKEYQKHILNFDNIEYSKELLLQYYDPKNPTHLPVIQGHYADPQSFRKYCQWFKSSFKIPEKIAIGTVCKLSDRNIAIKVIQIGRSEFPTSHLHVFGLRLDYIKFVPFIDSFDTMAWTFPREAGKSSCKNKQERIQFFKNFLRIYQKYNEQKTLL